MVLIHFSRFVYGLIWLNLVQNDFTVPCKPNLLSEFSNTQKRAPFGQQCSCEVDLYENFEHIDCGYRVKKKVLYPISKSLRLEKVRPSCTLKYEYIM